jgi:putative membrane protein
MDYSGYDGFLGTRASFMLDVVFLAMFVVVPVLGWSVWLVRYRRNFSLHKRVQLALAGVLLVAVTAFEIDMQFLSKWEERAVRPPATTPSNNVYAALYVHLVFAVTTAALWVWVVVQALRRFAKPPAPGEHSRQHMLLGRVAALDMLLTAVTGWVFYWLAFVG